MSGWRARDTDAYEGMIKLFKDTSVPQSITRARLYALHVELNSLIQALNDPRER